VPVPGAKVVFVPGKPQGVGNAFYRWFIVFPKAGPGPKLEPGEYELRVTGVTSTGPIEIVPRRFRVELAHAITITSHNDNDNM
jgi:hypothetical protein